MKKERILKITAISFIINFLYAGYTLYLGITSHSWWFIALSAYYTVLSFLRILLLNSNRLENKISVSSFCGKVFILLSVCLAGITYLSYEENIGTKYNEIIIITIAVYTFSKIVLAIINLIKDSRHNAVRLKALRNVSFADALASIFSLQRSMLISFEGMSEPEIKLFNALTGTAVYLLVFLMGLNLIGGKTVTMAKSKIIEVNEKIAESETEGYKKIENGVVNGYKKIENGVVSGYNKIEDVFVEKYLMKDNETKEEVKERTNKK